MTTNDFLQLLDHEKNRLIGEKIMGWRVLSWWDAQGAIKHLVDENQCEVTPAEFKDYVTDIRAAWEIVEKVREINSVFKAENPFWGCSYGLDVQYATALSAPLAISIAALKAVGVIE